MGCNIEVYTGLVIDHVVLSNFRLGCAIGPKPSDVGYTDWLAEPKCHRNTARAAGHMEVEAALILLSARSPRMGCVSQLVSW